MHRKYGYTYVNNLNAEVGNLFCNRSAAAFVNLAELACLPCYALAGEEGACLCHEFCVCIVCAALTSGACVFCNNDTLVETGSVEFIVN